MQNFETHLFSGTARRRRELLDGKWAPKTGSHFTLRERGKVRPIDAPKIADRQIEKVHSNEVLVPLYTPSMIHDNGAKVTVNGSRDGIKRARRKLKLFHREFLEGKRDFVNLVGVNNMDNYDPINRKAELGSN